MLGALICLNIETIRYYERIGLVKAPDRTSGGTRQYNQERIKELFFIKRSRELGFSLDEIRALLAMISGPQFTCREVHAMTLAHLHDVRKKISDLQRLERVLVQMASKCSRGAIPDCPIVDALFDQA